MSGKGDTSPGQNQEQLAAPPSRWREESDAWKDAYLAEPERRRRLQAMPRKLRLLGIEDLPRDSSILDLCCGSGEAMLALASMGFTNLTGLDIEIPASLSADPRFVTHVGDARATGLPDSSFDYILNVHAMHHLETAENIELFLQESYRLLRPGGRLGIVDFPNSLQIRLAFWFFRQNVGLWTPYLRMFGRIIREEWHFLRDYLPQWHRITDLIRQGKLSIRSEKKSLFYFYLVLEKT
jgi:ubiquinone/menaquinone biosynthesis C-methylase UbiE